MKTTRPSTRPEDDQGRKDFSSGSDLSGICFTPEGFVTLELAYASWNDGDGNYAMYSEEYFQHQRFQQDYYIRSFDRNGQELTSAHIDVPEGAWLDAHNMARRQGQRHPHRRPGPARHRP